jgi:hypothetical protein
MVEGLAYYILISLAVMGAYYGSAAAGHGIKRGAVATKHAITHVMHPHSAKKTDDKSEAAKN